MTKANLTEIVVILDRSGSMDSCRSAMEEGFNSFIREQRSLPGECRVTLVQFDDVYESVYRGLWLHSVPPLRLEPRGYTALFDAVGKTINEVGSRLAAMLEHERPGRVAVVIITDGCENASKEFSGEQVQRMISHQREKYCWEFIFMGAGEAAYDQAARIGVVNAVNFVPSNAGYRAAARVASSSLRSYRSGKECLSVNNAYASALAEEEAKEDDVPTT